VSDEQHRLDELREALQQSSRNRDEEARRRREENDRLHRCQEAVHSFSAALSPVLERVDMARCLGNSYDPTPHTAEIAARLGELLALLSDSGLLARLDLLDREQALADYSRGGGFGTPDQAAHGLDLAVALLGEAACGREPLEKLVTDLWFDAGVWPAGKWFWLLLRMLVGLNRFLEKTGDAAPPQEAIAPGGRLVSEDRPVATAGIEQPALDPGLQAILDKARAEQGHASTLQHAHAQAEARWRRAHEAWLRVCHFRGDAIPRELTGDALYRRYAELIVDLGRVLKADGWQGRIDAVQADTDAKVYALSTLRKAMEGDTATVTVMVREAFNTLSRLGLQADGWLRQGLMDEVLDIRPGPEPPLGWEGSYLEAVETVEDFVKWIDGQFLVHELAARARADETSDGRLVRNAFRLVTTLELRGMPLEPTGPFTRHDELAVLRNLRRLCREWQGSAGTGEANGNPGERQVEAVAGGGEKQGETKQAHGAGGVWPTRWVTLPESMWPRLPPEVVAQVESKEPLTFTLGRLGGMLETGGNLVPATLARCRELPAVRSHAAKLGLCRPGEFTATTVTAIVDLLCVERGMDQRTAYAMTLDVVAAFLSAKATGSATGQGGEMPTRAGDARLGNHGQAEDEQGEVSKQTGIRDAVAGSGTATARRDELVQRLEPAVRLAYLTFCYAESKAGKRLEDREAHELLKEDGIPEAAGERGELAEYRLPAFDTWARYLRDARNLLGEQKYTRRAGRPTGKSVVRGDQVERRKDDAE
jgi:hypothetical protein